MQHHDICLLFGFICFSCMCFCYLLLLSIGYITIIITIIHVGMTDRHDQDEEQQEQHAEAREEGQRALQEEVPPQLPPPRLAAALLREPELRRLTDAPDGEREGGGRQEAGHEEFDRRPVQEHGPPPRALRRAEGRAHAFGVQGCGA